MRLLNLYTLRLETFLNDSEIPPYAILSHTWGARELKLQDLELPGAELETNPGWKKVVNFCRKARESLEMFPEEVRYGWVDSCCIDKSSSAELSEAINSMFRWYRSASACFVLLEDVELSELSGTDTFERCRWFTRGWTLQELLAPPVLYFFDKDWQYMDDKLTLADRISARTSIDVDVIMTGSWEDMSIAQRMSWASTRTTTRVEDMAYCLMGVFDVNMPTIYGEGEKAFIRLQEEIMKESADESIFAWDASAKDRNLSSIGALATSPAQFHSSHQIEALPTEWNPASINAKGVYANLSIINQELPQGELVKVALLSCRYSYDINSRVGIPIRAKAGSPNRFARTNAAPISIPVQVLYRNMPPAIYLDKRDQSSVAASRRGTCWVQFRSTSKEFGPVYEALGPEWHVSPTRSMTAKLRRRGGGGPDINSLVVPFQHEKSSGILYLSLRLALSSGVGAVGMRVIHDDPEPVKKRVEELRGMTELIALGPQEQAYFEPMGSILATVTKLHDDQSVFQVVLSARLKSHLGP
jgi:hypothetical protein